MFSERSIGRNPGAGPSSVGCNPSAECPEQCSAGSGAARATSGAVTESGSRYRVRGKSGSRSGSFSVTFHRAMEYDPLPELPTEIVEMIFEWRARTDRNAAMRIQAALRGHLSTFAFEGANYRSRSLIRMLGGPDPTSFVARTVAYRQVRHGATTQYGVLALTEDFAKLRLRGRFGT